MALLALDWRDEYQTAFSLIARLQTPLPGWHSVSLPLWAGQVSKEEKP